MARYTAARSGRKVDTFKGVRVSPEVYNLLRAEAARQGVTLLAMVEKMVQFYLEAPIDE